MEQPLVNGHFQLEKYPGKGGWTYASLPDVLPESGAPFGWRLVRGTIDGYGISKYHLMPGGKGHLFLPVRAAIRKTINKQAGDTVHIVLFQETLPVGLPYELLQCLADEPAALAAYYALEAKAKQQLLQHIAAAKTDGDRADRMARAINQLAKGI